MDALSRAWAADSKRGCLTSLISIAIGLPVSCCMIGSALWLANSIDPRDPRAPLFILLFALALFVLFFGGAIGAIYFVTTRRQKALGQAFAPLGLEGGSHLLTGHQFHGQVRGRRVDVYITRGPTLTFYVESQTGTRLAAAPQEQVLPGLAKFFNNPPLEHGQQALQGISLFAHDPAWGQAFARHPAVHKTLPRLLGDKALIFRQLHIRPDAVSLTFRRTEKMFSFDLDPQQTTQWIYDLCELAQAAEQLPEPAERLSVTPLELRLRTGGG